jgi:hypothetical protein
LLFYNCRRPPQISEFLKPTKRERANEQNQSVGASTIVSGFCKTYLVLLQLSKSAPFKAMILDFPVM